MNKVETVNFLKPFSFPTPLLNQSLITHVVGQKIMYAQRQIRPDVKLTEDIVNEALHEIQDTLLQENHTLKEFPNMPIPPERTIIQYWNEPRELREELIYDRVKLAASLHERIPMMNACQDEAFTAITNAIDKMEPAMFYLDAPGDMHLWASVL